ncbi:MAG: HDOD domain-containing protein [Treponema sp.]|jgi:hypothetical protein|nr:HDOD domain-containing protein [Treponema sp.]
MKKKNNDHASRQTGESDGDDGVKSFFSTYSAMAAAVPQIISVCDSTKTDPLKIFTLVNMDPVLTSLTYSLYKDFSHEDGQEFIGIPQIFIKLNINTVKNTIVNAAKRSVLRRNTDNNALAAQRAYLRRSFAAATVSMLIAKKRGVKTRDLQKYYCAGLMHGIGGFILSRGGNEADYLRSRNITREQAGRIAAEHWGIPPVISDVIAFHDNYVNYTGGHGDVVRNTAMAVFFIDNDAEMAAAVEKSLPTPKRGLTGAIPEDLLKQLELDKDAFTGIPEIFMAELEKVETFMGVGVK